MFANFHGDSGPKVQKREIIDARIAEAWYLITRACRFPRGGLPIAACMVVHVLTIVCHSHSKQVKAPRQPFSLRLSSNLLIGISRVYNKQQLYLWGMALAYCTPLAHQCIQKALRNLADDLRAVWVRVQKKSQLRDSEAHLVLETKTARYAIGARLSAL
jgi:hypothetical protein